jgi:hypothetical protein
MVRPSTRSGRTANDDRVSQKENLFGEAFVYTRGSQQSLTPGTTAWKLSSFFSGWENVWQESSFSREQLSSSLQGAF